MRLRYRLLLLFTAFGIIPLLAMGVFDYVHSMRALDALLAAQTDLIADRAAVELRNRLDRVESDLALLGDNAETQELLRTVSRGDSPPPTATTAAERFWTDAWASVGAGYESVRLLDKSGNVLIVRASSTNGDVAPFARPTRRQVRDNITGAVVGQLEYATQPDELLGISSLGTRFGERGWTAIIDPARPQLLRSVPPRFGERAIPFELTHVSTGRGRLVFSDSAGRWVGSFVSLGDSSWSVVAIASVNEFAGPFVRLRLFDLALLIALVSAVAVGFFILVRRATRSLDVITDAADRVGLGDLTPTLPPEGSDEVGRLSTAFGTMTRRLRESLDQIEATRQVAVLGRFAAELSHEIRNPLTSIKLNLQSLARDAEAGDIPPASHRSLELALREIRRLDEVVRAALRAGRTPAPPSSFSVHALIDDAAAALEPQAATTRVTLTRTLSATCDGATGDVDGLRGALVNLFLNAIESMPDGGTVHIETENPDDETIQIRILDEGSGIPAELRDRAFQPFVTSKPNGTGLGLSLALQAVRAQGGAVRLSAIEPRGTEARVTLRLAPAPVPA